MTQAALRSSLGYIASAPAAVQVDVLAFPVFEGEDPLAEVPGLAQVSGEAVARAVASREVDGKLYDLFITPVVSGWRATRILLVGAGKLEDLTTERLRRVVTAAALAARQRRVASFAFVNRGRLDTAASVQAIAEGLMLAAFSGDGYKSHGRANEPPEHMFVVAPASAGESGALEAAVTRGGILGESCNLARELCNEPSNVLTPSEFAARCAHIAREVGLSVEVFDERDITQLQMGLLLGVAKGSAEPPRLIVVRHEPPGAPITPVLGLVGKGITFDTGGISIKPADGMERMKDDMAGGAAVVCAMRALALLDAPVRVVGVVPATENMPGGRALKPGDVLKSASGTTVEVVNTDAEGRLILGDALWYAQQLGATHLVDVATLTGACVVALGKVASGLFGQPDWWVELVAKTAERAGDRCWRLPLYEEYGDQLRSEIADMMNSGGRPAGACTAATFLREFAGMRPWAHIDVAGTAWADEAKPWQPKGATGIAVRTLAELAFTSTGWR
jgi:leucyl aminopeptidase